MTYIAIIHKKAEQFCSALRYLVPNSICDLTAAASIVSNDSRAALSNATNAVSKKTDNPQSTNRK